MARLIDVDETRQELVISFPFSREVVECVKGLPSRTFDPGSRTWTVPLRFMIEVVEGLEVHHFKLTERARALWLEAEADRGQPGPEAEEVVGPLVIPPNTWSISKLNHAARQTLRERFHSPLWVVGELQGVERSMRGRGPTLFF